MYSMNTCGHCFITNLESISCSYIFQLLRNLKDKHKIVNHYVFSAIFIKEKIMSAKYFCIKF